MYVVGRCYRRGRVRRGGGEREKVHHKVAM
jgi:hypothetical protein